MFSVEPTLARMFFRSGAEVLVGGRLSLGAEDVGLADVGFLSMAEVPEGRGDVGVGFTRLGTVPAGGAAPGTGAFFFMALLEVLFERLKSAAKVGVRDNKRSGGEQKGACKARKRWGFRLGFHKVGEGIT